MLVDNIQKINELLSKFFQDLWDGVNENILPALKETLKKIQQVCQTIYDELSNVVLNWLERAVKELKAFEEDFAKIGKAISESLKRVGEFLNKYVDVVRTELNELIKVVVDTIKSIPAFDVLKEKLNEVSLI